MAEQGRIVMQTVGATGSRGPLTSNTVKLCNTFDRETNAPGRVSLSSYLGQPCGSGFTSNQRPAIYYRPSLDHIDNPQFGLLLSDSFMSQTKRHFQPHIRSDCSLPNVVNKPRGSGFHQLKSHQRTETAEDKTEYQRMFVPHCLTPTVSQDHVTVGPKGGTGFTEGTDLQPNTFQEKSCTVEPHQTHSSVMKTDFKPPSFLQGAEARPSLCCLSSRETGFTRGAIAPLAYPTSFQPSPQTKSNAPTEKTIGRKEPTGSLLNAPNNQAFPNTPFDRSHFTTHYKSEFYHRAEYEKLKSGRTCAGIISTKKDYGYRRRDMDRFIFSG